MDQPTFSTEGPGVAVVVVVVEGEGEVGDFDVSPGWRSALIAEGSRVVWVQRSVDEDGQSSTAATLPPFSVEKSASVG